MSGLKLIDLEQGTPAWHDWRNGVRGQDKIVFLTATASSSVMGVNPWCTAELLWQRMLGLKPPQFVTAAMARGTQFEEEARQAYIARTANDVLPACIEHPDIDWLGASLDGLGAMAEVIVEIKVPGVQTHAQAAEGKVPRHYWVQIQHQLLCAPCVEEAHYWSYSPENKEGHLVVVERDTEYHAVMLEALAAFRDCLTNRTPPGDGRWLDAAARYRSAHARSKQVADELEQIKHDLERLVPPGVDRFQGGGVTLSQRKSGGGIDWLAALASAAGLRKFPLEDLAKSYAQLKKLDAQWDAFEKKQSVSWSVSLARSSNGGGSE